MMNYNVILRKIGNVIVALDKAHPIHKKCYNSKSNFFELTLINQVFNYKNKRIQTINKPLFTR